MGKIFDKGTFVPQNVRYCTNCKTNRYVMNVNKKNQKKDFGPKPNELKLKSAKKWFCGKMVCCRYK